MTRKTPSYIMELRLDQNDRGFPPYRGAHDEQEKPREKGTNECISRRSSQSEQGRHRAAVHPEALPDGSLLSEGSEAMTIQPDFFPQTITARAANGHMLVYRVIGKNADGTLQTSSWDAQHSDDCNCASWDVDDWGDLQ